MGFSDIKKNISISNISPHLSFRVWRGNVNPKRLKHWWLNPLSYYFGPSLSFDSFCLCSYESGALGDIWPLGRVTLRLHGPFLRYDTDVASAVLGDVTYPETPIVLEDLHLITNESVQSFRETARRRIRWGHNLLFFCCRDTLLSQC